MDLFAPATLDTVQAFAVSLALGLLIGLERERKPDMKAGLRTFGLVAMFGTLAALLAESSGSGWLVAVGLLLVGGMMIVAHAVDESNDGDPGTTSVVALLIAYGLGVLVWYRQGTLAVMLAIATTVLLYFKTQLEGFTKQLTHRDLISVLQFAVLSFIILPILPNEDFGPYAAFNPHEIWWMVVLISGLSLAGYAALRLIGTRFGAPLLGLFGGLASSTATTLVFARRSHEEPGLVRLAAVVIVLANLVVLVRLLLVTGAVAPQLLQPLAIVLGFGFAAGAIVALFEWRSLGSTGEPPMPEVGNPTELKTALSFGLLYGVVLMLSAWLQDIAGNSGLYFVALASGLTDVDAIALSTMRLFSLERLTETQAVTAIGLAALANLTFKTALVVSLGGGALARRTLPGLSSIGLGLCGGLLLIV